VKSRTRVRHDARISTPHACCLATLAIATALACAFAPTNALASGSGLRLLPGGIVYPEFNSSGTDNPAALGKEDASVMRILGQLNLFGSTTQELGLDYGYSKEKWGLDAGYDAYRSLYTGFSPTPFSQAAHAAAGYRFDSLGIGLGYIHPFGASSTAGTAAASTLSTGSVNGIPSKDEVDLGLTYETSGSRFALVLRNLNGATQANLGYGATENGKYAVEFDLGLPSFSQGLTSTGSTYTALLALSLYLGERFGVGYRTTYSHAVAGDSNTSSSFFDTPLGFEHSFTLLFKASKTESLSLRFDTSSQLTLGITFKL
jgi:hypothetical protein